MTSHMYCNILLPVSLFISKFILSLPLQLYLLQNVLLSST